jgi:hypothetical protein
MVGNLGRTVTSLPAPEWMICVAVAGPSAHSSNRMMLPAGHRIPHMPLSRAWCFYVSGRPRLASQAANWRGLRTLWSSTAV